MINRLLPLLATLVSILLGSCVSSDRFEIQEKKVSDLEREIIRIQNELQNMSREFDASSRFDKEMACQDKLDQLKTRWSNIVGCHYSEVANTFIVSYEKDGVILEARIEDMVDSL